MDAAGEGPHRVAPRGTRRTRTLLGAQTERASEPIPSGAAPRVRVAYQVDPAVIEARRIFLPTFSATVRHATAAR